ncbi:hypothetical protein AB1Y20_011252 [Prymnesium parvum]|uniref:Uncharacterized protein n=1 Tax=Prymnesium parvum TaxID=97485 RepID=A0AB34IMC6_PRYPA
MRKPSTRGGQFMAGGAGEGMSDRVSALQAKQQELLQKIAMLEQAEAEEAAGARQVVERAPAPASGHDILQILMHKQEELQRMKEKRDELLRMQAAVSQLGAMSLPRVGEEAGDDEDDEENDIEEDIQDDYKGGGDDDEEDDYEDDDDDDDGNTVEMMQVHQQLIIAPYLSSYCLQPARTQKLMMQQRELMQLRAAIESAKAGDFSVAEEPPASAEELDDDQAETEMHRIFATLMAKKRELDKLLETKAELEAQLREPAEIHLPPAPAPAPSQNASTAMSDELRNIMERRRSEQAAVDEQERKLAELTALQSALRSRLDALESEEQWEEEPEEEAAGPSEEQQESDEVGEDEQMAQKLLELITVKTQECEQLASVVEEARAAGMASDNPRLLAAERSLAARYMEVKELASIAEKLGLDMQANEEEDDDEPQTHNVSEQEAMLRARAEEAAELAKAAYETAQRLKVELQSCEEQLESIDSSTSPSVAQHPAFTRMRNAVQQKLISLRKQASQAYETYEQQAKISREAVTSLKALETEEEEEIELTPLLKEALDNLWQRPYDCKVFTLQLLQALAELDDRSVCMMSSCFARYIETHSAPASL